MPAFLIQDLAAEPFVFLHNPKTGGQALRKILLESRFEGPAIGPLPDAWQQHFCFSFVRNPFDRLISAWKMFSDGIEDTGWKVPLDLKPGMSLNEFLEIVTDDDIEFGVSRNDRTRIRNHTLPQSHAFYNIDQADFVGRFESYSQDVVKVFDKLKISRQPPQPRHVTKRGPYRDYYDDDTRQIATDFYAADLQKFGYEF